MHAEKRTMHMATPDKSLPALNFDKVLQSEADLEPFRIVLDGKPRDLLHLEKVDSILLTSIGKGVDSDWKILHTVCDEETYKLLRDARPTVGQLQKLVKGYLAHCGFDADQLGE